MARVQKKVAGVRRLDLQGQAKGIIERRDQLIDLAINHSKKVIGFLVGSEHNFALLEVTPDLPIYPAGYSLPKLGPGGSQRRRLKQERIPRL